MAEGNGNGYIQRVFIGERLNEEYPRDDEGDDHIQYFYFQVEVILRNEQGGPLQGDDLESTDLNLLFPGDLFEWSRIVEDFGTVKKDDLFKITYIAKYRHSGTSGTARQVETKLDNSRIAIRDRFKKKFKDDEVDVLVLMSRACNYSNGGKN